MFTTRNPAHNNALSDVIGDGKNGNNGIAKALIDTGNNGKNAHCLPKESIFCPNG